MTTTPPPEEENLIEPRREGTGRAGGHARANCQLGVVRKTAIAAPNPCSKWPFQARARRSRAPPRPHARNRTEQATREPMAMSIGHFRPTQSGPTARGITCYWSVASPSLKKAANEKVTIIILSTAAAKDDGARASSGAAP